MPITLIQLYELNKDPAALLEALQKWHLIPRQGNYNCPKCSGALTLRPDSEDGWRWHCDNKISERKQKAVPCGGRVRFRKGTFFAGSHLDYFNILAFAHFWAVGVQLRVIKLELGIGSDHTLINWSSFCREVRFLFLLFLQLHIQSSILKKVVFDAFLARPEKLGGPGVVVEIDEAKFGKRKFHRGHRVEGQWVFGGYERHTGRIFMVAVEDRFLLVHFHFVYIYLLENRTHYCQLLNNGSYPSLL